MARDKWIKIEETLDLDDPENEDWLHKLPETEHLREKYNPYHGWHGRFTSGGNDTTAVHIRGDEAPIRIDGFYKTGTLSKEARECFLKDSEEVIALEKHIYKDDVGMPIAEQVGMHPPGTLSIRQAAAEYQGMSYAGINERLREGKALDHYTDHVNSLDRAHSVTSTKEEFMVMRGFRTKQFPGPPEDWVGAVFEDKGFLSTTLSPHIAKLFADVDDKFSDGRKGVAVIKVPKGTKAFPMSHYTSGYESEILLARGTKLKVVGYGVFYSSEANTKTKFFEMEVVND